MPEFNGCKGTVAQTESVPFFVCGMVFCDKLCYNLGGYFCLGKIYEGLW